MSRKHHRSVNMMFGVDRGRPPMPCVWPGCDEWPDPKLPLCAEHISEVWDHVQSDTEAFERRITERSFKQIAQERRDEIATNKAIKEAQRLRASKKDQPGWVYFLLWNGQIKIGYTTNIERRLREYPPGSTLLALHPGTPRVEQSYHQRFGKHRIGGREWYITTDDITRFCDEVTEEYGPPPASLKVGRKVAS